MTESEQLALALQMSMQMGGELDQPMETESLSGAQPTIEVVMLCGSVSIECTLGPIII